MATLAGRLSTVPFLLEEGAETARGLRSETELEMATRLLAKRAKEKSRMGRSWQQQNPPHLDPKLNSLSESMEISRGGSFFGCVGVAVFPVVRGSLEIKDTPRHRTLLWVYT